jgi:wobble nucleotide-excising tRNase
MVGRDDMAIDKEIEQLKSEITPEMEKEIVRICDEIKRLEPTLKNAGIDMKKHLTKALKKLPITDAQRAIIRERLGYWG